MTAITLSSPKSHHPEKPLEHFLHHPMATLMQKIAEINGLTFSFLDGGRIIRLEKGGRWHLIQGFILPVNLGSSTAVTRDKSATSDLLKKSRIPQVRHRLFLNPTLGDWTPKGGSWPMIHAYVAKHKFDVVCKPKDGSAGRGIQRASNGREVEQAVAEIFKTGRDVVICAFKPITNEFRVLVYKGRVELILRKILPTVTGDGKQTLAELISSYLSKLSKVNPEHRLQLVKLIPPDLLYSQKIPEKGEEIPLHWKHNGPGALTEIIGGEKFHELTGNKGSDHDNPLLGKLMDLAAKTVHVLNIRFASVDIVELPDDPKGKTLRVLEVNSATWLDSQMDTNPELSERAELQIYQGIINDLFHPPSKADSTARLPSSISLPQVEPKEQKILKIGSVIAQIARVNGWAVTSHSQGWISHLSHAEKVRVTYGYTFPLNSSTSTKVCGNKPAVSSILKETGIPQIRHHRFLMGDVKGGKRKHFDDGGVWSRVKQFAEKHGNNIVCKPAEGTGGNGVEHVTTIQELESVLSKMLGTNKEVALCSFKKIRFEYRLIMLDGEAEVIFKKIPPYVIGDGINSTQVLTAQLLSKMDPKRSEKLIKNINPEILVSETVPAKGKQIFLHWKHNLGQGALCELIGGKSYQKLRSGKEEEENDPNLKKMIQIAKSTMEALRARFVSVDIVQVDDEPKPEKIFRVMEVNSGIMMDNLMEQQGEFGVQLATTVYTKALGRSFNEEV